MMQKNETAIVTIEDIGVNGEGIGKVDGYTLFIKDAVIGDVVEAKVMKAKKNYGYARLMKIITPSKDRVTPVCTFARKCGGCQIQEMSYEQQLQFKHNKVRGNLERIGGFSPELLEKIMEPVVGMEEPFHYRNKAQFPFGTDKEGNPITGFYAGRTHDIIANTDCALGVAVNKEILASRKQSSFRLLAAVSWPMRGMTSRTGSVWTISSSAAVCSRCPSRSCRCCCSMCSARPTTSQRTPTTTSSTGSASTTTPCRRCKATPTICARSARSAGSELSQPPSASVHPC